MPYIELSSLEGTPFEKLMGHAPHILKQRNLMSEAFVKSGTFEPEFLEQVRRVLALKNGCQYCMDIGGPPSPEAYQDNRLSKALLFADQFAPDHRGLGKIQIGELKQCFSNKEIVELIAYCSFVSASQRFGAVLGLGK